MAFTSRNPVCGDKNKSFGQAFSKACGFQRQSLWSSAAALEILLSFKLLLKGKSARQFCLADWGTFCKRKSSQLTTDSHNPEKPPGGRFFCCRSIIPVSKRQRSASLAVHRGNSEAPSRHAHLRETAKHLSLSPFHIHIKKRGKIPSLFFACGCTPECNFSPKTGYR